MSFFPELARWLVYQQDYFWFLVALGWGVLGVGWWRFLRSRREKPWLPWAASLGIITAATEVSQLIFPITIQPGVAPWLVWDMTLGIINALFASGLWWLAWREGHSHRRRAIGLCIATGIVIFAPLRGVYPAWGSWLTALTLTGAVVVLLRRNPRYGEDLVALSTLVAANWCSTAGPLAEALHIPHRYSEFSLLGPVSALLQVVAIFSVSRGLVGFGLLAGVAPDPRGLHAFFRRQVLWLAVGLIIAYAMGRWARANFEQNVLSRVQLSAELIDRKVLAAGLDERFHLSSIRPFSQQSGDQSFEASSEHLGTRVLLPVAQTLSRIELANPDAQWAFIQTLRDGWLVACCTSTRMPGSMADVGVYGRATASDLIAWSDRRVSVTGPIELYYGAMVQARAPLLDAEGRMRGWLVLDFTPAHWLAAQVSARLLAFSIVALGSALLVIDSLRRQRERQGEEAARQAEIAQVSNRMKAAFLAKVSHELRTPIQSLLGYSELLRLRVADDAKAAGWLAALRQHGELMTRLVNDLIDLGAVEAGAFQLAARTVEPSGIVTQLVESFRPHAEARQLTLACFTDPEVPEWVALDGERFRQVLTNLVGNALKFTARGGVTVALRAEAGDRLVLTVRDTGPGIPPAEQDRLFVAFSRLELTADKEGSGLGLALSAALCKAMGGALRVESDGVSGACFIATFHAPPAAPLVTRPAYPSSSLRGRRILVIDDNPLVRELFIAFLTEQGAMCAAASCGKEALAQGDASGFDAVILDLALPDVDGTELVQPLRARARDARLIGVSAHAGATERERALAAGMDAFLTKPVELSALAAAVTDAPASAVGGPADFRTADALRERLTRQFSRELPAQRSQLDAACDKAEWLRIQAIAHYLKNSAVVVRDDGLFATCTGLEEAATAEDRAGVIRWRRLCEDHFTRWTAEIPGTLPFPAGSAAENDNPK